MSSLYIDGQMLSEVQRHLRRARELAERPGREMAHLDADAVGSTALVARLRDFGDEWSYGIKQIAEFADQAADALQKIDAKFHEADRSLAEALTAAGKK